MLPKSTTLNLDGYIKIWAIQVRREVLFFEKPGPTNTEDVIVAVSERIKDGDIKYVVVASVSGKTALRVAQQLRDSNIVIICVSGSPSWSIFEEFSYPMVKGEIRRKLEGQGVTIVDKVPSTLSDTVEYGLARYGYIPASFVVAETLEAIGGYGLKTAVEAILMATDSGAIPAFTPVISIAGTDKGADTAIVAKSTYSSCVFSKDSNKRFQVFEIIAMPRIKKWYKEMSIGEFSFHETANL